MSIRTNTPPLRVNTAILAPYFQPGEPAVIVKLVGVGSTAPFEMRGGGTAGRSFIMEWNTRLDGHVVRIPLSMWMAQDARMAHELMDHRRMSHAMVVMFEMPTPVAAVTAPVVASPSTAAGSPALSTSASTSISISISQPGEAKTGAAETSGDASIVVGRGTDPQPAAPTLAPAQPQGQAPAPTNETVTAGDAGPPMIGGRPLHEAAHEKLIKPQRVKALAAALKVSEATLREAAGAKEARIEIAGPWVRRRAV